MQTQPGLDRALSFLNCQLQPSRKRSAPPRAGLAFRAVTMSRQTGSGAHIVAEKLAAHLQAHSPKDSCPWTVFDRNLVEKVLEDHNLPQRLAGFMPEDRVSELEDTVDDLLGLHPPSWTLVRQTTDTILRLVELGNVILIGRGATVITARLDYVFHVRIVGSLEKRVKHVQELNRISKEAALDIIRREDRGRKRYLKKYFGMNPDDPLQYHLIINTDSIACDEAARIIGDAIVNHA
ncbi:MAG TPA: cytidylate kinase-like family protein [Candidatus Paceibacterota bacterium]|nr:cytidylate kinase-like family protein [Verrucomicrobiota bacterium]HSA09283.1 cytidylate kinase-like family protein [Candidatus Paceibacterota bacterium]